jgi:glyoxylate reductase
MGWNVYVTRRIPEAGLEMLRERCQVVEVNPHDRVLTRQELLRAVVGRDGVLCLLTDCIDVEVLDAARGCKVFANCAVGYDNIDVPAATARGVVITNTPGVLTDSTADLTWALIFAVARRIVEGDRYIRDGKFEGWEPMLLLGGDITGQTLGIVGAGRIGQAVARRSVGFQMKVLYTDPSPRRQLQKEVGARRVELDELLRESDFVSLHTPLLAETRHLIGRREFALMKPTAYLINAARGPIVDEEALVEALRDKRIAGAGLDVYENEPELSPGLADLPNVVLLPHLGSASTRTRTRMATMAAEDLLVVFDGRIPPNLVNADVAGTLNLRR